MGYSQEVIAHPEIDQVGYQHRFWDAGTLFLPPLLWDMYYQMLLEWGKAEEVLNLRESQGIYGGQSTSDTLEHLTYRFAGSAAHMVDITIDPQRKFDTASNALRYSLSSHRVTILDAFCGAGAATLSLVTTMILLRKQRRVPCLPLSIHVIGLDFSPTAILLFESGMRQLAQPAALTGITISSEVKEWNACDPYNTAILCDGYFHQHPANEFLVLISAVSGLKNDGFEDIVRSIQHIEERLSRRPATMLWIEPEVNEHIRKSIRNWKQPSDRNVTEVMRNRRTHTCNCFNEITQRLFRSHTELLRYVRYE